MGEEIRRRQLRNIALDILMLSNAKGAIFDKGDMEYTIGEIEKIDKDMLKKLKQNCEENCNHAFAIDCVESPRNAVMMYNKHRLLNKAFHEEATSRQKIDEAINEYKEICETFCNLDLSNFSSTTAESDSTQSFMLTAQLLEEPKMNQLVGVVKDRKFVPFADFGGKFPRRLTELQMQEGQLPESQEINLDNYEGLVMMVSGNDSGNWIYSAQIVEVGGAILSAIAKKVLG